MKDYFRLIKYTKAHLKTLIFAAFFMVLAQVFQPVSLVSLMPLIRKVLIGEDLIFPNKNLPQFFYDFTHWINSTPRMQLLGIFILFYLVIFLLRSIFTYMQYYLMRETSQGIVKDIRDVIYNKLLSLSMKFYSISRTGSLVSHITFDTTIVQDAVSEGLTDVISNTALFIFSLLTLIGIVWVNQIPFVLILISVVLPPLIIIPVVQIGKRLKSISKITQEAMADINNVLYETISGIRIVKAFSMEEYEHQNFQNKSLAYKKAVMKANKRILAISPITELMGLGCGLIVIWFFGKEVIAGNLKIEVLIAFLLGIMSLIRPLNRLSRVHSTNQQALAAASRIFNILDTEVDIKEKPDAVKIDCVKESIKFENVSFGYDNKIIIKNINIDIKAGDIVAFVGPSGTGKTTLVSLIPRFYDPTSGTVAIDDINLKDISIKSLRAQIGIVTQDTVLFNDTVFNNIAYGNKNIAKDKVISAAKTANAHDFIMKMPEKYNTIIGERGFKISGGEKQRLAIARAVLKNPPILIFDEATSQLDSQSEILVQDAIDKLMTGRTVFVIAHRLSTIKHATKIIVLDKGKIADQGTHDELLKREGMYKVLYEMQFKNI